MVSAVPEFPTATLCFALAVVLCCRVTDPIPLMNLQSSISMNVGEMALNSPPTPLMMRHHMRQLRRP